MQRNTKEIFIPNNILELDPYKPGKSADIDTFSRYRAILCSNENNLGPSPKALSAIADSLSEIYAYPDPEGLKVVKKLKEIHNVDLENIVLSNGLDGLLYTLFKAFTIPGDEVISSEYSFVAFNKFSKMNNVVLNKAKMTSDYCFDLNAIKKLITDQTRIIYLCNPNNPTGTAVEKESIIKFLKSVPSYILIVIDEAYIEFAKDKDPDFFDSIDYRFDNVLSLRTLSKIYGLAGLRIGYGIGSQKVIEALKKVKLVFNPNTLAQAASIGALEDEDHLQATLNNNSYWKNKLEIMLHKKGIKFLESYTNFVTIIFDDKVRAKTFNSKMDKAGVLLRKLDGFGLPIGVRISIGNPEEMQYLLKILSKY